MVIYDYSTQCDISIAVLIPIKENDINEKTKTSSFKYLFTLLLIIYPAGKPAFAGSDSDFKISDDGVLYSYNGNDTSVTIPDSVTEIYDGVFQRNNNLVSVTIPSNVKKIGDRAFDGCENLTTVIFNKGLKEIGRSAFSSCKSLTKVVLPDGLEIIEFSAFSESRLQEITIPDSVKSVGTGCFDDTPFLKKARNVEKLVIRGPVLIDGYMASGKVTIPDKVKVIAEEAFLYNDKMTSVVIPSSIKTISFGAFKNCSALTSVTIKNGVEEIGDWAFTFCTKLTSISIPSSVKSIGSDAFTDTPWLKKQTGNGPYVIINNILIDGSKAKGAITIPKNVTKIAKEAFFGNNNITSYNVKI